MRTAIRPCLLTSVLVFGVAGLAPAQPAASTPPAEADPGVRPFRLIDRDEIRVSRVELQPGAVRRVHAHDDVEYHVWAPVSGTLEITIGTQPPQTAAPGQAFFMVKGTPHGFRNTGTVPAAVFEIFVKRATAVAGGPGAPTAPPALADLLALGAVYTAASANVSMGGQAQNRLRSP